MSSASNRSRVCVLSLSRLADDPRVRRQGDALHSAGWDVHGVGLAGGVASPPGWPIRSVENPLDKGAPAVTGRSKLVRRARLLLDHQRVRIQPSRALDLYWSWPQIRAFYDRTKGLAADLWVANDWIMLPIAARLCAERGGVFVYDTHEFAVTEYSESLRWRLLHQPIVRAVEGAHIRAARAVTAVSPGIAERLHTLYRLPDVPTTIRNVPFYQPVAFRPTGTTVRVLYHGIVAPGRGLEAAIDSVPLWQPNATFTIRGPGNPDYLDGLRRRIAGLGVGARVELAPPVPMTDLVAEAAVFDIGLFTLPGHSEHNAFALPNKVFEYTMAGLALCVSDLPEMARLVAAHKTGITIPDITPPAIAAAINGLKPAVIDGFKRNALEAARELCWECEARRMLDLYRSVSPPVASERLVG